MELSRARDGYLLVAPAYRLTVTESGSSAELADPAGAVWSRLSLLASLHRVDVADETYAPQPVRVTRDGAAVDVELRAASTAWTSKAVTLRCLDDRIELTATVHGTGTLGTVQLLGGSAVLPTGAGGTFRSSIGFRSVFDPTPTAPVQVVRPPSAPASLGVLGDSSAGRCHGLFAPPPLCVAFGREPGVHPTGVPAGPWLSVGVVAPVSQLRFTELRYRPEDDGFLLELDYDGHTVVDGEFCSPSLVIRPTTNPWQALYDFRGDLLGRGAAPAGPATPAPVAWWRQPLFCGWGAQCAAAVAAVPAEPVRPADLCDQERYDRWLDILARHGIVPGTVVIDDCWQRQYGTGVPDTRRWPDLRGWIAGRHAAGQRVLLWWKAWDATGLPVEDCVLTPDGVPVAADPASPTYVGRLRRVVHELLGPDGLDADGFKVDFLQRSPAGRGLLRPGAPVGAAWGIALLHELLAIVYRAAKSTKPDALIVTHAVHPAFADVTDMVRLNDILEAAPDGAPVPPVEQMRFRHRVVTACLPHHPVDTDQWPIGSRAAWRDYVAIQPELGVPSLYYADRVDVSTDPPFGSDDYDLLARSWQAYRKTLPG